MEGGKIIQRGTPRDIYESPANLFVARFIGEINVMDGKLISQREPGIWQAEVEGRECLLHTTLPFQPDDKVLVLLRPEICAFSIRMTIRAARCGAISASATTRGRRWIR